MNHKIENDQIAGTLSAHREFFSTHITKEYAFRIDNLVKLKKAISRYEKKLSESLKKDLNKSPFEAYITEIGFVQEEISYHIHHLKKWMKPERIRTDLVNFHSRSYILREPFGLVLIMSPWNYPFQLLFDPLVGAISAGNCMVLKPAHYSEHTSATIRELVSETFDPRYISVFTGGRDVIQELLGHRYDYIFFTGSAYLGKIVMEKASKFLTPVSLELGGKSPCIVEDDADLDVAARRLTFGKLLNSGQTCIAPDYILVNKKVKKELVERIKKCIVSSYGANPLEHPDYGRIINNDQFEKLSALIKTGEVIFGGEVRKQDRCISPTILDNVRPEDPIMQDEIFGPIFPIMEYGDIDEAISFVNSREKPLAFYLFTSSRKKEKMVFYRTSSGGGCVNDTMLHLTNPRLPFGGVGYSGMGMYHGKHSFDTFSHHRSILAKSTWLDVPLRYPPYRGKLGIARKVFK